MKTITRSINVYSFSELSEKAKQHAKDHAARHGYAFAEDALASLKALAEHFGGSLSNWDVDFFNNSHSFAHFGMPEMEPEEIANQLDALGTFNPETLKGHGDCVLTGYCADEDAIDGLRIAFLRDGERDLSKLMQAAFSSWLKAAQSDCEDQFSDETFSKHCDANEYQFCEDGSTFHE